MKPINDAVLLLTAAFSVLFGGGFPLLPAQETAGENQPDGEPVTEVHAQVIRSEAHDEIREMIGKPLPITIGPDGLPSGPEEFNRARDEIVNRTEPLTYDEYFEIVGRCELKWAGPILWNLMKERQNPPVSTDELKALYERKRDSIKTFYAVFRDGDKTLTFALKGDDQFYLEEEDQSKAKGTFERSADASFRFQRNAVLQIGKPFDNVKDRMSGQQYVVGHAEISGGTKRPLLIRKTRNH